MSINDEIIKYYDNIAEDYNCSRFENSYGEYIDWQERNVLDKLNIDRRNTLDLPCGTGRLLNYADYGCDASKNMLKVAGVHWREKHLICSDARNLPYEDGTFDTVITMHFLMHLDAATTFEIAKEIHRILRPGGRWIIDLPSLKRRRLTNKKSDGWHGSNSMDIDDVRSLLSKHFNINSTHGIMLFPIHRIPSVLRKPLCKLDYRLSQVTGIKEWSSYIIYELWKS